MNGTPSAPVTRLGTPGYKALHAEFAMSDFEDAWGTTLSWWFSVAELLYHKGQELPATWQFRDSPVHDPREYEPEDCYEDQMLSDMWHAGDFFLADLRTFGDVLTKYLGVLKLAGQDY